MKNRHLLLLLFFTSFLQNLVAQNAALQDIKTYYYEHKKQMDRCEPGTEECVYYVLENIKNKYQRPISAVGHHFEKKTFWYIPDEEIEAPFYGEEEGVLIRKEERYENGLYQYYREFFYKNKQVVFFFHQDNYKEYRYYFTNGVLLSYKEKMIHPEVENRQLVEDYGKIWQGTDWEAVLELAKEN